MLGVCASRRQTVKQKEVGKNEAGSYGKPLEYFKLVCEKAQM